MSFEILFATIVIAALVLYLGKKFSPNTAPKETHPHSGLNPPHFKCARCGIISQHTERTIEAWRNNKTQFFCLSCHRKWLQAQPRQENGQHHNNRPATYSPPRMDARPNHEQHARYDNTPKASSGCLSSVVIFTFVPIATYFLARAYT